MSNLFSKLWRVFPAPAARLRRRRGERAGQGGFSLVETIVSSVIIIFAIVGPLTAAQKGLASAAYSKDQVTAAFLAEEGVEYVQYLRAQNSSQDESWLKGLSSCLGGGNYCGVDPGAQGGGDQVVGCSSGNGDCLLYFNNTTGAYGHRNGSGWVKTKFRRKIHIDETNPEVEAKISSTVYWQTPLFGDRSFTVTEYLMNWRRPIE